MKSSAPCLYGLKPGESPRCYEEVHQASGYCKKHQKEPFKGSTYRESRPSNWRNLVSSVLRRDKSICYVCGEPGADSADHVKPRHLGGTDALHNLKAIHQNVPPYCHRTKTSQEANEQRRKMNTGLKRNRATLYN